jgi:hypothetical protein
MNGTVSALPVAQIAIAQIASFASLLLVAAGLHKLKAPADTARAMHGLTGLPLPRAARAVTAIAAAELAAAAGLWFAPARFAAALLAALLWGGYFVFLVRAVAAGRRDVDCGCSFSAAHRPLGAFQLWRAAVLTGIAVMVALGAALAPGAVPYVVGIGALATQLLAGLGLLALYVALDQLMAIQPLRAGVQA